jgi:hypothetical protein
MGSPYFQLIFKVLPYYCGIATTTIKSCGSATYSYSSVCGNATSSTISHVGSPHTHTFRSVEAPQVLQLSHTIFYCVQNRYTMTINEKCLLTIFDVFRPVESQASFAVAREPQRWCVFLFSTRDNAHWGGLPEQ